MGLLGLGDTFPDFSAETTDGPIEFYKWKGDSWALLFSHPNAFTPVCTTELGAMIKLVPEFAKRNCKVIGLSVDSAARNNDWAKDIIANEEYPGHKLPYPVISDEKRELAVKLGMLDPDEKDAAGIPAPARAVFIISPDNKMKLMLLYPATTGRVWTEILRALDSVQLTAYHKVATPVNWQQGDKVVVLPTIPKEDLPKLFPKGVEVKKLPSGKEYLRLTPQPNI